MKLFVLSHLKPIAAIAGVLLIVALGITLSACTKKTAAGVPAPLPVNAVDSFDAWAFQQLSEVKAGLEQTKTEITAGNLPKSAVPIVNQAIGVYDLAEGLAARYHDSGGTGPDAAQLQAEITGDISQIAGTKIRTKVRSRAPNVRWCTGR